MRIMKELCHINDNSIFAADPQIIFRDGIFYLFGTNQTGKLPGFLSLQSSDLISFAERGLAFAPDKDSWSHRDL